MTDLAWGGGPGRCAVCGGAQCAVCRGVVRCAGALCGVRGRCAVCMVLGGVRWCSVVCGGVGVRWCAAVLAPGGCPRVCRKQREADTGPESPQEPPEPPKTVNRQEVLPGVELDLGAGAGYRFPAPAVPKVSLVLLCDACFPPIWDSSLPGLLITNSQEAREAGPDRDSHEFP